MYQILCTCTILLNWGSMAANWISAGSHVNELAGGNIQCQPISIKSHCQLNSLRANCFAISFFQTGGKICTCLAFMSTFRIKGRICCKLQRISPPSVIFLKLIKSYSFKGKMENEPEELLPHGQFLRNISHLLDFKGIILTNAKELLPNLQEWTILWGF